MTNNHVVKNAKKVEVKTTGGKTYTAKIIGTDPKTDLALLKVDASEEFPHVAFASTLPKVGDWVVAMGNPFGLGGTVTAGIVSAQGRDIGSGPYDDYIQIDAPVNSGNSGGPTFNLNGEVIGINTMIASNGADQSSGIGFAIPINTAKAVLGDLTKYGRVRRPSLGIVSYAIGPDLAQQMGLSADSGVLIQRVIPGGAAERADLRGGNERAYVGNTPIMLGGDLIIAIDGQQITDPQDISAVMDKHQAGDTVAITVLRGQKKITLKLILGEMQATNT